MLISHASNSVDGIECTTTTIVRLGRGIDLVGNRHGRNILHLDDNGEIRIEHWYR